MKRLLTLLCLSFAFLAPYGQAGSDDDPAFDEIIVFGASMSDTGNAFYLSGYAAAAEPYFGGRFSDGPVWVEWLANELGLGTPTETQPVPAPGFDPSFAGTNFAVGGAGSGDGTQSNGAPNLGLQIAVFFQTGGTLDGDELIVVQGGGADASAALAAKQVADHIADLASAGGKYFLVPNQPRRSQQPRTGSQDVEKEDAFTETFDLKLQKELDALEETLDITIYRFDLLALHDDMIANKADYGLTNITDPACPGCADGFPVANAEDTIVDHPEEYMFWDFVHFTAPVHKIIGQAAAGLILD